MGLARSRSGEPFEPERALRGRPPTENRGEAAENRDIFRHSATVSDNSFDVDIPPNETASFVARLAGTFNYTCKYHPGVQGRLIVAK